MKPQVHIFIWYYQRSYYPWQFLLVMGRRQQLHCLINASLDFCRCYYYNSVPIAFVRRKGNPRPHLIALMLFALANRLRTSSRPMVLLGLLPISILWANLHGASFPVLIILQIAYIVIGTVPVTAINSISFNKLPRQELYCRLLFCSAPALWLSSIPQEYQYILAF